MTEQKIKEQNIELKTTKPGCLEWIEHECDMLEQEMKDYEERPNLKFPENEVIKITIDFSKPFQKWTGIDDNDKSICKSIIPCTVKGEKFYFWCNTKNPIYRELIRAGRDGQDTFKILRTGQRKQTRYALVKE